MQIYWRFFKAKRHKEHEIGQLDEVFGRKNRILDKKTEKRGFDGSTVEQEGF